MTEGWRSSGEVQGQIEVALEPGPQRNGRGEKGAGLICIARTLPLLPSPMDFQFPTVEVPLLFAVAPLLGTSDGFLTGLSAEGGMF